MRDIGQFKFDHQVIGDMAEVCFLGTGRSSGPQTL
jgi:hypothetical protein